VIFLEQKAFDLITEKVGAALAEQGFAKAEGEWKDGNGRAAVFTAEEAAYSVYYNEKSKRFELRTCEMDDGKPDGKWKCISMWLFDPETDSKAEAESILNDFIETIQGPKRVAELKTKKKRKKDDENNPDPIFFFNRFVGIFPELKEELAEEKAKYGDVRAVTFTRNSLLPKIEALCAQTQKKDAIKRCCDLLNDMYVAGDMDVRSIITIVILNGIENQTALENMKPFFSDDLKKSHAAALKLKGKKIKPEKKKKETRVVADNLNTLRR
jgi:hypothetical protein